MTQKEVFMFRCDGMSRNLKINTDSFNVDGSLNVKNTAFQQLSRNDIIIEGIIGSGESSCLSAQYFINSDEIILGCFDSSQIALDGLLSSSDDFIFDQQPFLIGYISTIMMTNKILIDTIPSQLLIETEPKQIIYTKQCENQFKGFGFCPINTVIVSQLNINFPTLHNLF